MSFISCSKDDSEKIEFKYYAPNAKGVYITEKFIGKGINIDSAYIWVSHNVVLWHSDTYNEYNQRIIGGLGGYFKYYPFSLDKLDQFISHIKIFEGEDNHVVDIITPTREPILEYLKKHNYRYIASSPFHNGDVFLFNITSNEYFDELERPGETIYNGDEDL